jgi:hypothetical protein
MTEPNFLAAATAILAMTTGALSEADLGQDGDARPAGILITTADLSRIQALQECDHELGMIGPLAPCKKDRRALRRLSSEFRRLNATFNRLVADGRLRQAAAIGPRAADILTSYVVIGGDAARLFQ